MSIFTSSLCRFATCRLTVTLIVGALFVSGCSGSDNPQANSETIVVSAFDDNPVPVQNDDLSASASASDVIDDAANGDEGDELVISPSTELVEDDLNTTADSATDLSTGTGTGTSISTDANTDTDSSTITGTDTSSGTSTISGTSTSTNTSTNAGTGSTSDTTPTNTSPNDAASSSDEPASTSTEPVASPLTRVDFDITVPAYLSDALRIRLIWDDKDIDGTWLAAESWLVSDEFPKDTTAKLVVIFYDENGDIALGSYETEFKTGSELSETFTITADQFDTARWDADDDGVSNIDELIAGTDHLVDESILPVFQNDLLRSLLPNRQTLFGQNIENIPNPDRTVADNLHVWEYDIINDQLTHDEHEAPLSHQIAWQRYVELTLPEDRKGVKAMKFLQDNDGLSDLYTVGLGTTTMPGGVAAELQLSEPFVSRLFTNHEQGWPNLHSQTLTLLFGHGSIIRLSHLIKWQHEYDVPTYALGATRVLWDSPLRSFMQDYWEGEQYDTFRELNGEPNFKSLMLEKFPGEFVNRNAASGHTTDFVETFRAFVNLDGMPELGDYDGAEKVRWFWSYPEFVNMREYARAAF